MSHAGSDYWDRYFVALDNAGSDLDWGGRWTEPFLQCLREAKVQTILELGCGTGNDAARLARMGFDVTATDFSAQAIKRASERFGSLGIMFRGVDMAEPLPFPSGSFDALMSNVSLHMFNDRQTRQIFREAARVVRPDGLLLLHVNSDADRSLREKRRLVSRELEPNYVLEESGQTVRFFSREYLDELLSGWRAIEVVHVEIEDADTGEPFKCVWRVVAQNRLDAPVLDAG